jgi:hypothetical protein
MLASGLAASCMFVHGQRYSDFTIAMPIERGETLVIGFLGGRDAWDDTQVGVGRFAARLRRMALKGLHVEIVENKERELAVRLVHEALDRNRNGDLETGERAAARIVVYGQSFGGAAVVKFARELGDIGVPILLTVQIDSVGLGDGVIPPNVRAAANLYQASGRLIQGEHPIRAEEPGRTWILGNYEFDYDGSDIDLSHLSWFRKLGRVAHARMDRDSEVWNLVERIVLETIPYGPAD